MTIIDANDHAPQFDNLPYVFSVVENNEMNYLIGQIIATDQDSGRNAELQYSIIRGILFSIHADGQEYLLLDSNLIYSIKITIRIWNVNTVIIM